MANGDQLKKIDSRLTTIERTVVAIEEQIAFLIARGVNQTEEKFPSDKPALIGYAPGDVPFALGN